MESRRNPVAAKKAKDPLGLAGFKKDIVLKKGDAIPQNMPWGSAFDSSKLPSLKKRRGFNAR